MTSQEDGPRELTAQEKHERARAFALSGSLSSFQKAKKQRQALEAMHAAANDQKNIPVKAKKTTSKPKKKSVPKMHDSNDPNYWPTVQHSDWQYVYIAGSGPFAGRFGYYEDHEKHALVYFGAPVLGDGPYEIPLRDLRIPPAQYSQDAFIAL